MNFQMKILFFGIAAGDKRKEMIFMNIEQLRAYLIDYLGSGMINLSHNERAVGHISPWHPNSHMQGMGVIAMGYLGEVKNASAEELIELASHLGII